MTIEEIVTAKEGENFEFKTAENRFSYTELQKYASAISNEGGGKIVFGITDKRPRKVIGSKAFDQPERTRKGLIDSLRINVDLRSSMMVPKSGYWSLSSLRGRLACQFRSMVWHGGVTATASFRCPKP